MGQAISGNLNLITMSTRHFTKSVFTMIYVNVALAHIVKVIDMPAPAQPPKQQKMAIAVYTQPGSHNSDGLLVLDAKEIDELLCVLTLCAFLEVCDSFALLA